MRAHIILLFTIFSVILLSPNVLALGISPSRTIIDFEPGLKRTFQFYALNSHNQEFNLEVYVGGSLAQYITPSVTSLHLSPAETIKGFTVTMELPQEIETPGIHDNRIGIVEAIPQVEGAGAAVVARVGVESQLWIRVPYPGIYAEIGLETEDVAVGEDVEFTISIANRGTQAITAKGDIKIYEGDSMIASLDAGSVYLESKKAKSLKAVWSTRGFGAGVYRAVATVKYDGESRQVEKIFHIGALTVDIVDLHKASVFPGEVAKMALELKSFWNEPLGDTYAELEILDGENILAKPKSENFVLNAWENRNITIYVDTEDFKPGEYDAKVTYNYAVKKAVKTFENRLEVLAASYDLYIYVVAGIVIVAAAILVLKKKKRKKGKKRLKIF